MNVTKIALIGGSMVLALGGMAVGACSSSTPTPVISGNQDSGTGSGSSSGGSSSGSSSGGSSSGSSSGGSDGGTSCTKPPALHVPAPDGGVYCPYSFNDATDAGIQYCATPTPQCCVSPSTDAGPSDCEAVGACTNSAASVWQCSAPSDCAGYPDDAGTPLVCCLISGPVEADSTCTGFQKTEGLDSVSCLPAAQCTGPITIGKYTDTHYVACEQQSDCTATASNFGGDGGTCTPVFTIATSIGLCL